MDRELSASNGLNPQPFRRINDPFLGSDASSQHWHFVAMKHLTQKTDPKKLARPGDVTAVSICRDPISPSRSAKISFVAIF
jgi:hypothetical protein